MIEYIPRKGKIQLVFFLSFTLCCCTHPGDHPLNDPEKVSPASILPKKGPELHTVEIDNMKFQPEVVSVHTGDTILWINKDMVSHCVTEVTKNAWMSPKIPNGASWKMVASSSADYYCAIHQVMKGKIIIE